MLDTVFPPGLRLWYVHNVHVKWLCVSHAVTFVQRAYGSISNSTLLFWALVRLGAICALWYWLTKYALHSCWGLNQWPPFQCLLKCALVYGAEEIEKNISVRLPSYSACLSLFSAAGISDSGAKYHREWELGLVMLLLLLMLPATGTTMFTTFVYCCHRQSEYMSSVQQPKRTTLR